VALIVGSPETGCGCGCGCECGCGCVCGCAGGCGCGCGCGCDSCRRASFALGLVGAPPPLSLCPSLPLSSLA